MPHEVAAPPGDTNTSCSVTADVLLVDVWGGLLHTIMNFFPINLLFQDLNNSVNFGCKRLKHLASWQVSAVCELSVKD